MNRKLIVSIIAGLISGFISGLFGTGGGILLVLFFHLLLKKDEVVSRATTIFCMLFIVSISSFIYYKNLQIDRILIFKCSIGGIIGGYIGSKILIKIDKKFLKILFAAFLFYTGARMIL